MRAFLAGQHLKVLLIESVERLLEKSTRDAFSDLLQLAAADKSLRIVLTCRDYSTDLVRASFLAPTPLEHSVVVVPELDDGELTEIATWLPTLAHPLANPPLRQVLRNPYFLDRALQISWSADRPLPESERGFRAVFWQQIIRAEDRSAAGMPSRRDEAFRQIALRRARGARPRTCAATTWTPPLSTVSGTIPWWPSPTAARPWWRLPMTFSRTGRSCAGSSSSTSPTTVRIACCRKPSERTPPFAEPTGCGSPSSSTMIAHTADGLLDAVVDHGAPAQFRDDTLVSLLCAPSSPAFLERHVAELLANDRALLRRVIHLLRVACMTAPRWLPEDARQGALLSVPEGPAWASVLSIVQTHVRAPTAAERLLLLGLIKDWASGVAWWAPYPAGAEFAAAIAHGLLPDFDTHGSDGAGRQILSVIAKIPRADGARFDALLRGAGENDRRNPTTDALRDIVLNGVEGMPAARDFPDLLVSVATDYLLCSEADLGRNPYYRSSIETFFGLKEHLSHKYFPASAYRGPWLPLLQYHPRKGLDFLTAVFNHSADWYAHPRVADRVEPPFEIELAFPDGTPRKQWADSRLWQWHRGTSVGPYVLQCLLMALERWLLDSAEARPDDLDAILLGLLQRSRSVALTGVVASVAIAFPHAAGETLLVLLSSPACIQLDRHRLMMEVQSPSRLPSLRLDRGENMVYQAERKEADALPHRRRDLEVAIASLQLGPVAARVRRILDGHREALPPAGEQTDDDRVWRLSMHRMDLRRYSVAEVDATQAEDTIDTGPAAPARQVRLELDEPEPDVKEMVEERTARLTATEADLGLVMWALHVFKNDETKTYDPTEWRQRLGLARTREVARPGSDELDMAAGGPGIVAAVCVRDHWPEMAGDEQDWCVEVVCREVLRHASDWNWFGGMQRYEMSADRSCASVVSLLLEKPLSAAQTMRVRRAFMAALTHPVSEVRWHAVWGIARQLWSGDGDLAMRCVNALAVEAAFIDGTLEAETERPYDDRRQTDDMKAEAASAVRERFWQVGGIAEDAYQRLNVAAWFGAEANGRILAILSRAPAASEAVTAFARAAQTLVRWWDLDADRESDREDGSRERNHDIESTISELLQSFVLRTSADAARSILQPCFEAVDSHPRKVHWIIEGLIAVEDREPNTQQFWFVWDLFADRLRRATWLVRMDDGDRQYGSEVVFAVFLGSSWREEVHHWRSLEGYAHRVHGLFEDLLPSAVVLDAYVRFLYHIGEQSLPEAFVRIAGRLQAGEARRMLRKTNTVFMLEVLLRRHVYGRPLELKRQHRIRGAVLDLLDVVVEQGSSAAFRMRDDFVTPVSAT